MLRSSEQTRTAAHRADEWGVAIPASKRVELLHPRGSLYGPMGNAKAGMMQSKSKSKARSATKHAKVGSSPRDSDAEAAFQVLEAISSFVTGLSFSVASKGDAYRSLSEEQRTALSLGLLLVETFDPKLRNLFAVETSRKWFEIRAALKCPTGKRGEHAAQCWTGVRIVEAVAPRVRSAETKSDRLYWCSELGTRLFAEVDSRFFGLPTQLCESVCAKYSKKPNQGERSSAAILARLALGIDEEGKLHPASSPMTGRPLDAVGDPNALTNKIAKAVRQYEQRRRAHKT